MGRFVCVCVCVVRVCICVSECVCVCPWGGISSERPNVCVWVLGGDGCAFYVIGQIAGCVGC